MEDAEQKNIDIIKQFIEKLDEDKTKQAIEYLHSVIDED